MGGSDGAGEVIEIGSKVTKWKVGDRVATVFNPGHQSGPLTAEAYVKGGIGGTMEGTFQEYGVFEETGLVRLASNLSYIEGATLSDAAVTAWNALYGLKPLKPGEWVLVQGTGGVSLFAVQVSFHDTSPQNPGRKLMASLVCEGWRSQSRCHYFVRVQVSHSQAAWGRSCHQL